MKMRSIEVRLIKMRSIEGKLMKVRSIEVGLMKMRSIEGKLMKMRSIEVGLMKIRSIEGKLVKMPKPASTCDKQAGHWQEQRSRNRRASRCLTPWLALSMRDTQVEVVHSFLLGDYEYFFTWASRRRSS